MTRHDFVEAAVLYCQVTGASVTSWGRTTARNAKVNGKPYSPHLFWLGLDVVYDEGPVTVLRGDVADRLGLRLINEGDHDHLQPRDWRAG
jgi:hypothetical protein